MDRLTCNLRNVKRPIRGLFVGKTIVRDELGVEIPLRIYSRIKRDCNVFAVIDGKEYIIPTEEEFKKLLLKADTKEARGLTKPIMYVADTKEEREMLNVTEPHIYSTENNVCLPHIMAKDENGTLIDTGIPVEESDGVITTASVEVPEEVVDEEPETIEEETNVEESTEGTVTNHQQNNNRSNRKNKNRR